MAMEARFHQCRRLQLKVTARLSEAYRFKDRKHGLDLRQIRSNINDLASEHVLVCSIRFASTNLLSSERTSMIYHQHNNMTSRASQIYSSAYERPSQDLAY